MMMKKIAIMIVMDSNVLNLLYLTLFLNSSNILFVLTNFFVHLHYNIYIVN